MKDDEISAYLDQRNIGKVVSNLVRMVCIFDDCRI